MPQRLERLGKRPKVRPEATGHLFFVLAEHPASQALTMPSPPQTHSKAPSSRPAPAPTARKNLVARTCRVWSLPPGAHGTPHAWPQGRQRRSSALSLARAGEPSWPLLQPPPLSRTRTQSPCRQLPPGRCSKTPTESDGVGRACSPAWKTMNAVFSAWVPYTSPLKPSTPAIRPPRRRRPCWGSAAPQHAHRTLLELACILVNPKP